MASATDHALPVSGRRWRRCALLAATAVMLALVGGCGAAGAGDARQAPQSPAEPSLAPDPVTDSGLQTLATAGPDGFALHVESRDASFLPGINLGSTNPGSQPGELSVTPEDFRRWLDQMAAMGIRVVRIYTILPPSFYAALADHNRKRPDAPLYLVQGVYLPDDVTWVEEGDLWADQNTAAFRAELRDASAAVHGDLERGPTPGRASGSWTADVSSWVAGWIIGVEWDGEAASVSDRRNSEAPGHRGRYFRSTKNATPTERWLAAAMDELASAEASRGTSAPIAFVNWPTTDPLTHPWEPHPAEDLIGIDANHVRATAAWPGGTFASYHAYPYYPDVLRHSPKLRRTRYRGRPDPYAGYLTALREHHVGMPVVVSEVGVPSSLGSAHDGPLGRDQGNHTEQEAMRINANLLRLIHHRGMAGAFLFAWTDEWFKVSWNTVSHQRPGGRRALWHDVLSNEEHFGVLATDPLGPEGQRPTEIYEGEGALRSVTSRIDEAYVHLRLELERPTLGGVTVGVSTVDGGRVPPSGSGSVTSDHAFVLDPERKIGRAWVRTDLDPVRWDGVKPPSGPGGWNPQRLLTSGDLDVRGTRFFPEYLEIGNLRHGELDRASPRYDNLATWRVDDAGTVIDVRLPWGMIGISDPSTRHAVALGGRPRAVVIPGIGISVGVGRQTFETEGLSWNYWQSVRYEERTKHGVKPLIRAFRALGAADARPPRSQRAG